MSALPDVSLGEDGDEEFAELPVSIAQLSLRQASRAPTEDESSLFNIIKKGKASFQTVANDWIDSYKDNKDVSLTYLLQFFVNATGSKTIISPEANPEEEYQTIIEKMTEEFDVEKYPLIMGGQIWKKFQGNFCSFINCLMVKCQNSIIYDGYMLHNVISLLSCLSTSNVRAFRHTSTLAGMKIITALVDILIAVLEKFENVKTQHNLEERKPSDHRSVSRLETLTSSFEELKENIDDLRDSIQTIFQSIFVHRFRDVAPEIRSICQFEIGEWIKKYPEHFLEDTYLKYIGWTVIDKVPDVRLKCLDTLDALYKNKAYRKNIQVFTAKFKQDIIAMSFDKEKGIAPKAIKIVMHILKNFDGFITEKDCERIYLLVYSSNREVAHAAGDFLYTQLLISNGDYICELRQNGESESNCNAVLMKDIVEFLVESEFFKYESYLVDALLEQCPIMKDWDCMTKMLLEKYLPKNESLDNMQEICLVKIMVSCIKQSATGKPPIGRETSKKLTSAKYTAQLNEDKVRLTEHFVPLLPQLLSKYRSDAEKIVNLLLIPQYFKLDLYVINHQEMALNQLLKLMQQIIERHSDFELLESAARTYKVLCDENLAIYTKCNLARSSLLELLGIKLKEAHDNYFELLQNEADINKDLEYTWISCIKKVAAFYSAHDMTFCKLWDVLSKTIAYIDKLPEQVIEYSIKSCFFEIMWDLHTIDGILHDKSANVQPTLDLLQFKLNFFVDTCKYILSNSDSFFRFKDIAYFTVCDLFIAFGPNIGGVDQRLVPLITSPDEIMQHLLNNFVQNYVFKSDIRETCSGSMLIDELDKRRKILAGFCKLALYGSLPTIAVAGVARHHLMYFDYYGDIIKLVLGSIREMNEMIFSDVIFVALQLSFIEISKTDVTHGSLLDIKNLARRFSLFYGLDLKKIREGMMNLHSKCLNFAFERKDGAGLPDNILFLEVLTEFIPKLLPNDRKTITVYLVKETSTWDAKTKGNKSLILYQKSLSKRGGVSRNADDAGGLDGTLLMQKTKHSKKSLSQKNKKSLDITIIKKPRNRTREMISPASSSVSFPSSESPTIEDVLSPDGPLQTPLFRSTPVEERERLSTPRGGSGLRDGSLLDRLKMRR